MMLMKLSECGPVLAIFQPTHRVVKQSIHAFILTKTVFGPFNAYSESDGDLVQSRDSVSVLVDK